MPIELQCRICCAPFQVKPYRRHSALYCSRKCQRLGEIGSTSLNCLECGELKPLSEYYVDNLKARGRVARCKTCYKAKSKIDRLKPRHRFLEAKSGAKTRGISWNLTYDQYLTWIANGQCYYCGEAGCNGIDRLNNEPYYDETNAVTCCGLCNRMKSDLRLGEFLNRIRIIYEKLGPVLVTSNAAVACGGK